MTGLIVRSGFRSAHCAFAALLDGRFHGHFDTVERAASVLRFHGATEVFHVTANGTEAV